MSNNETTVKSTDVLIVAKTHMGNGACIGGITVEGRSVRLIAHDAETNPQFNKQYNVGEVWRIRYQEISDLVEPHIENIRVTESRFQRPARNITEAIERFMPPAIGSYELLYDGLVRHDWPNSPLYIAEQAGVPSCSTMFWRPDKPLQRVDDSKRIQYRYPTEDGGPTLTFVGFQTALPVIPAGSLLRVSLAQWWRPEDKPNVEYRCYVQLSGWFIDETEQPLPPEESEPSAPTRATDIPAEELLHSVFGYSSFRPLQAEIIHDLLEGRDALVVMPTGSGKSLCYQIPALMFSGLTVVVTPLISLMQDQVIQLQALGVAAAYLNANVLFKEYVSIKTRVRNGQIKLLYVAPATLLKEETLVLLEQSNLSLIAVDEAHCVSEWGHDFVPDYRKINEVRERCPSAVCLAITATATPHIQQDIYRQLNLRQAPTFIAALKRENLYIEVKPRVDGLRQVLDFLADHPGEPGIVYCSTKKEVNRLTTALAEKGVSALPYHADLDAPTREQNQNQFRHDKVQVIVATIAFGMGIDKGNVRFVIHYNLPKNPESYYQEIGRAGRDGEPAHCLLLYSRADTYTIRHFINEGAESEERSRSMRLNAMVNLTESRRCRWQQLLEYFGESDAPERCERCDNCTTPIDESLLDDITIEAQKFLSCVLRTGERFGTTHIIQVLRGSKAQKVLNWKHDKLSVYGIGEQLKEDQWKHLANQFLQQGLVVQDISHGQLLLTERGRAVLKGEKVFGTRQYQNAKKKPKPPSAASNAYDKTLFERLRALRMRLAEAENISSFRVFYDRTLIEMATNLPRTRESFATLHGVGEYKLEQYADTFLQEIEAYCQEHQVAGDVTVSTPQKPPKRSKKRLRMSGRHQEVVDAFLSTESIQRAADTCNIQPVTVMSYLEDYVLNMERALPVSLLLRQSALDEAQQTAAINAFLRLGTERLKPVFVELEETVSYDELRLLRLCAVLMERQGAAVTTA